MDFGDGVTLGKCKFDVMGKSCLSSTCWPINSDDGLGELATEI